MLTAHAAAALLNGLAETAPLATLLPPLGFPAPRRLDRVSRERLGLTDGAWTAALAINGPRRALLLETADGPALRERLPALARTLARQRGERLRIGRAQGVE